MTQQATIRARVTTVTTRTDDYVVAARKLWAETRLRLAHRLRRTRAKARACKQQAKAHGFQIGLVQGKTDCQKILTTRLENLESWYNAIETAIRDQVVKAVTESLHTACGSTPQNSKFINDYISRCLEVTPHEGPYRVTINPKHKSDLMPKHIAIQEDPSLPLDVIEITLPAGKLRFSWFDDLNGLFEEKLDRICSPQI